VIQCDMALVHKILPQWHRGFDKKGRPVVYKKSVSARSAREGARVQLPATRRMGGNCVISTLKQHTRYCVRAHAAHVSPGCGDTQRCPQHRQHGPLSRVVHRATPEAAACPGACPARWQLRRSAAIHPVQTAQRGEVVETFTFIVDAAGWTLWLARLAAAVEGRRTLHTETISSLMLRAHTARAQH
jgi:hypothetical protein